MPLVRISLIEGLTPADRRRVGDAVHRALVDTIGVPARDRFQVITQHARGDLVYDPEYLGVERSDEIVLVQITLSAGRPLEQKRALYRRIAENLAQAVGLRPQDAWVNLVEVAREDWSFGNGVASYAAAEAVPA
ncbi:MAG: tautomerase family protein [Betaproteobacteria bacterium]|nr:tautomerase family protein [Betaproteobacteria bacterium]MDH5221443.1 tautomerase family protein [Betaproteobacteria bacterium]MDH5352138.1 tautomerase family protein [Betaproteobacteria bacterium]